MVLGDLASRPWMGPAGIFKPAGGRACPHTEPFSRELCCSGKPAYAAAESHPLLGSWALQTSWPAQTRQGDWQEIEADLKKKVRL